MIREERELELLEKAKVLIERDGFFSFKLTDISKIAGVPRSTVYSHFKCKEDILVKLYTEYLKFSRMNMVAIINNDYLNDKERIMSYYLGMCYIPLVTKQNFGVSTIVNNSAILHFASEDTIDEMLFNFDSLQKTNNEMWRMVIANNSVSGEIEDVLSVKKKADIIQKGIIETLQCEKFVKVSITTFDSFDLFLKVIDELCWDEKLVCSKEKIDDYISNLYASDGIVL